MKLKIHFFVLLSLVVVFLFGSFSVNATEVPISNELLPDHNANYTAAVVTINTLAQEPPKCVFRYFDVSETGDIALLSNDSTKKTICIYRGSSFLTGFEFESNGECYVKWQGEQLQILLLRESRLVTLNLNGDIVDVVKVQNPELDEYKEVQRIRAGTTYLIKRDMGIYNYFIMPNFTQVIAISSDGAQRILYDATSTSPSAVSLLLVAMLAVPGIFFLGRYYVKQRGYGKHL